MKENIQQTALTKHFRALGTSISLTVFGTLDQTVLEKSADLVNHYEDVLTVNRDHSQLMSVNQAAGKFPVQVEASVYQLTKLAVEKSRANFGFNAAIGPLVKLWHIGFSDAKVPSEQQISERLSLIDPWQIELNDADQSIFLKKAGMEIDLGAIAKGYMACIRNRVRHHQSRRQPVNGRKTSAPLRWIVAHRSQKSFFRQR